MSRRCLMLAPFPMALPRHGGQVRAASIAHALRHAGWHVDTAGLYHADFFPEAEWGAYDIVISDPATSRRALDDLAFGDLHVARAAAADEGVVDELRRLLDRLRPHVVHMEHPWTWPVLERALPRQGGPKIVYSSQNIEWSARPALFGIGLKRPGGDQLVEATRLLEAGFARRADLVLSISDLEGPLIAAESGRPVHYVPPVSDLVPGGPPVHGAYAQAAREARCRYAALMGSAYWPNVEGFFTAFPESLGFLAQDEQVWVAGSLGPALQDDPRYGDYKSVNDTRLRAWGYVPDGDKPAFFASASCVIVPVSSGAGAKLKTADALASGLPVVITPHALEGYGPLVQDALGQGVYVAETPQAFRSLVRRAMREGLPGCAPEIRRRLGFDRMADTLRPLYEGLLDGAA